MQISSHNRLTRFYSILLWLSLLFVILLTGSDAMGENEKKIRVGISLYSPPIFFSEDDRFAVQGISVDLIKMIAENMNYTINFYALDDLDYVKALEKGTVDIFIGIKEDFQNHETVNLIETEIKVDRHFFVNSKCDTFTSLHDLPGHTAILRGGNFVSRLLNSRNDIILIDPETEEAGLALLDSGEVQVYISHSSLLDLKEIRKRGFLNIKEVGEPVKNSSMIIASKKDDVELNFSLQKAYGKVVNSNQYTQILSLWVNKDLQFVNPKKRNIILFITVLFRYIIIVMGIIILAFSGIIFWNNMLKKKVNKIKKELYQSEQRYKDLIELSPDMIHLVSPDGRIGLTNKIALDSLGYSEDQMKSLRLHDLVSPEEGDKVTIFLEQTLKNNYSKSEFMLRGKGRITIQVEMVATIVKWDFNGGPLICTFSRDLTERKYLEENLINSDRLAIMGSMAAGLAHEINNPLGIILTNIGVLNKNEISHEDYLESIKSMERNALRAGKIIEDLLTFTRPSPLNKASFNLVPLIEESLLFLKHKIKNKDVHVDKSYPDKPIILWGDKKMIQQLLINLMLNAIQAVRHEGRITLAAEITDKSGEPLVSIKIKDNGIGISNDDIPKICNPFYTSRKEGGFGLGLFISKVIVEKHHGSIFFQSDLNKGTVVTVNLPLGVERT